MAKQATAEELKGRIAVSPGEAAMLLGIDRVTFYRRLMPLVLTGRIQSVKIGRSRRILVASLTAWVASEATKAA